MSSLRRVLKLSALGGAALALAGCCVLPFGHGHAHGRGYYGGAPRHLEPAPPGPPISSGQVPYRRGPMVY